MKLYCLDISALYMTDKGFVYSQQFIFVHKKIRHKVCAGFFGLMEQKKPQEKFQYSLN
jgi:hypothetical protein